MKLSVKRGFTLAELLVVIAIIAIFASVLVPVITGIVKNADALKDTTECKNLEVALTEWKETKLVYSKSDVDLSKSVSIPNGTVSCKDYIDFYCGKQVAVGKELTSPSVDMRYAVMSTLYCTSSSKFKFETTSGKIWLIDRPLADQNAVFAYDVDKEKVFLLTQKNVNTSAITQNYKNYIVLNKPISGLSDNISGVVTSYYNGVGAVLADTANLYDLSVNYHFTNDADSMKYLNCVAIVESSTDGIAFKRVYSCTGSKFSAPKLLSNGLYYLTFQYNGANLVFRKQFSVANTNTIITEGS